MRDEDVVFASTSSTPVADLGFLKMLYLKFRAWDPYETYGG
jgi:hypothetical protein